MGENAKLIKPGTLIAYLSQTPHNYTQILHHKEVISIIIHSTMD